MRVESVEIKNFKAISAESIDCQGRNVYVVGPNAVGKSSFLDAIFKTLTGQELPSKLTRDGATNGKVKIDLGEMVVEASFNANKEKINLTLTSPDGQIYKTPRTMLDQKIGVLDFDLNGFFAMSPKKKVEFIKSLVGIDFTDLDAEYKKVFEERTYVNRQVKELSAVVDNMTWDSSKTQKIELADVQRKQREAQEFNQKRAEVETRLQQRQDRNKLLEDHIAHLEKQIRDAKTECADNITKITQAQVWLSGNASINMEAIDAEFNTAIEHNKAVEQFLKAQEKLQELKAVEAKQATLNAQLAGIEAAKKEAIAEAHLPVPGLTFDEEQLYLNGLPFEKAQQNTAAQIIAGLQINLALMKEVKIARFDGSLLDNKSLAEVEAWAAENGVQLFVEMVQRDGTGMQIVVSEDVREEVAYA